MYNLDQLRIGLKHPNLACRAFNRQYYSRLSKDQYNKEGIKIVDEDWDVLLILDACRSDMFSRCCEIKGELNTKISRGSNTREFLLGNFGDEILLDTVYTTANPQFHKYANQINAEFHRVYNIWNSDLWDENIGTVHPDDVTEVAKQKIKDHPNKRHIVHYLQPHYPFINTELENIGRDITDHESNHSDIWGLQMEGKINLSKNQINRAYYKNLKIALEAVEDLIDDISGKIVITSDHGNLVGERSWPIPIKEWGHPSGIYTSELVEVPWLVIEKGERPEIRAEKSRQVQEDVNNEVVENRLKDLGYV